MSVNNEVFLYRVGSSSDRNATESTALTEANLRLHKQQYAAQQGSTLSGGATPGLTSNTDSRSPIARITDAFPVHVVQYLKGLRGRVSPIEEKPITDAPLTLEDDLPDIYGRGGLPCTEPSPEDMGERIARKVNSFLAREAYEARRSARLADPRRAVEPPQTHASNQDANSFLRCVD